MSDTVIKAEGLSKEYRIGYYKFGNSNLRDRLGKIIKNPLAAYRKTQERIDSGKRRFWALRDVSFEVKRGEVIGIIGRNGAGKSTLLKILSRITNPTKGSAEISGRIGSLLEVGTGFHEELTGRENIYLNGAILGLKKREIDSRFEQIVSFAEVEDFLDTPIKYYSSGMSVRLAFSIAAHLESEILLVDEVLSVGDMSFQKKCLGKIGEEVRKDRTVLFVSHNMSLVNVLCQRVLLLDRGCLIMIGDKDSVIKRYIDRNQESADNDLSLRLDRAGSGVMRFTEYHLEDSFGQRAAAFKSGDNVVIAARYISRSDKKLSNVSVAFVLGDFLGNPIAHLTNKTKEEIWPEIPSNGIIRCHVNKLPLMPGMYTFSIGASVNGIAADAIKDAGRFEVEAGFFFSSGRLPGLGFGQILINNDWTVDSL